MGAADQNIYEQLAALNVNKHVEKKGNFSYLSWAWAVDQLLRSDPNASWDYPLFQHQPDGNPRPYMTIGDTALVFCTVTAHGNKRTAQLPVMDSRNRPIPTPDAFEVNTAMQRCLAKAISLHGIGLYIYAGEDLPLTVAQTAAEYCSDIRGAKDLNELETIAELARAFVEDNPELRDTIGEAYRTRKAGLTGKAAKGVEALKEKINPRPDQGVAQPHHDEKKG